MKKALLLLVAAVLLAGAWSTSAMAEAGKLTGEVAVDYASRYIWRGIDLISDNQPAIQPRFSLTYGITDQLSVKYLFWADYRLVSGADPEDRGSETDNDWDEFDHVPSLLYTLNDTWSFELGYIWYYLPSIPNTQEVFAGATMVLPKNHYTSLYVYYDFDEDNPDGVYVKWTVGGSQPITDYAKCFYSAGLGYLDWDHRRLLMISMPGCPTCRLRRELPSTSARVLPPPSRRTTASRWTPSTITALTTRTKPG